jgi:hypothetical protein
MEYWRSLGWIGGMVLDSVTIEQEKSFCACARLSVSHVTPRTLPGREDKVDDEWNDVGERMGLLATLESRHFEGKTDRISLRVFDPFDVEELRFVMDCSEDGSLMQESASDERVELEKVTGGDEIDWGGHCEIGISEFEVETSSDEVEFKQSTEEEDISQSIKLGEGGGGDGDCGIGEESSLLGGFDVFFETLDIRDANSLNLLTLWLFLTNSWRSLP